MTFGLLLPGRLLYISTPYEQNIVSHPKEAAVNIHDACPRFSPISICKSGNVVPDIEADQP